MSISVDLKYSWVKKMIKTKHCFIFISDHWDTSLSGRPQLDALLYRPWSFKPVTDITGWYFFPVILFLLFPDKSIYSTSINWAIGNALMKPITYYKWQEQDYREKISACNVSYRLKRSGPIAGLIKHTVDLSVSW